MVAIRRSACSLDISSKAVFRHGIREKIIGYGCFEEWLPGSPDLTPMDFFLWGYLKQQVYATPSQTLQDFKRHITYASTNVSPSMLQRVQCEIQTRIQMCIAADGTKFEHLK